MASAAHDIYQTTLAQELYETSPEQELVAAPDGVHWLRAERAALPGFLAMWRQLAEEAAESNPFYEDWFLLPSIAHFDLADEVRIVAVYRDGTLAGLLPLRYSADYYGRPIPHWTGWLHANMFLGAPLVREGDEAYFWRSLLAQADENAGTAIFLHLAELPLGTPVQIALEQVIAEQSRFCGLVECHDRAVLEAKVTAEEYRSTFHSKRKRKDMRRRLNRLREQGEVTFEWSEGTDDIDRWIEDFLRIEASGWKGEAGSALACSADTKELFRAAIGGAAARNRVTRLTLRLDGRPIAMLANFLTPPFAFGFKTAFDDDYSAYSPGILLEDEYLAELDRGAFEWCDSCAAPDHKLLNAIWGQKRSIGKLSIPIGGKFRRLMGRQVIRLEMRGAPVGDNS